MGKKISSEMIIVVISSVIILLTLNIVLLIKTDRIQEKVERLSKPDTGSYEESYITDDVHIIPKIFLENPEPITVMDYDY